MRETRYPWLSSARPGVSARSVMLDPFQILLPALLITTGRSISGCTQSRREICTNDEKQCQWKISSVAVKSDENSSVTSRLMARYDTVSLMSPT
jgi:hypothetical protein